jgi:hypothetical protein
MRVMKYLRGRTIPDLRESSFAGSVSMWRKSMTKFTFVSAAVIVAAVLAAQPVAARSHVAAQHAMGSIKANAAADCARAPNVGAFASAPYTAPPCLPN